MTSAGFGPPGSDQNVDQPWGHRAFGPIFLPTRIDNPPVMGPSGAAHASLTDWARFASFHLGDGSVKGRRIFHPETFRRLRTLTLGLDYAEGWIVTDHQPWADGPTWERAGSNTVWFAYVMLALNRRFGVLVAGNGGGSFSEQACLKVADRLLELEPMARE